MATANQQIERDPETLMMFVEESLEALTRVEGLLLDAERGAAAPTIMDVLFRDMHTIKGTSGFLAFDRITALSHAAEDLLSLLRDGELPATPAHFAMLLLVVDALGTMITSARDTGDEGTGDHAGLAARLRAALAKQPALPTVGEPSAPAPRPPPPGSLDGRLGDMLVARGVVSPEQVQVALKAQHEGRLGQILVRKGLIDEVQLREALTEQDSTPLGERLIAQGAATRDDVSAALAAQAELRAEAAAGAREGSVDNTVRVSVHVLDRLMNLMGELVLARNQMVQIARSSRDGNTNALAAAQRLGLVTSELQEQIMKTRMQPVARVFEKLPRMVRDLSLSTGKPVDCQIEGNATELDRALIEAIRDPLMHIVRNAVDHGIEDAAARGAAGKPAIGRLIVRAAHEAGMVCIDVEDDGRGMDPAKMRAHAIKRGVLSAGEAAALSDRDALELIFRAGFSTAEKVTSISGRGVGMDVVRDHVQRAGGQVELFSQIGQGSIIRLKMPLTLAIIPALLVRSGGQRFCIPQSNLLELVYLDEQQASKQLQHVRDAEIYRLRGDILPIVRLGHVMGHARAAIELGTNIVVVAVGKQRYGLIVDEILDTEEIVVKPLHPKLKLLACYAGATVLGDGGVALILEVAGVGAMAGIRVGARRHTDADAAVVARRTLSLLVVNAGDDAQCAVPLSLVSRLEQIPARALELLGGREVVQYRGQIMPILRPERAVPLGTAAGATRAQGPGGDEDDERELQIVVFDFGQPVGVHVNAIVDIVETAIESTTAAIGTPCCLGNTVLFGRTTLLLDVHELVRRLAPDHAPTAIAPAAGGAR